MKKETGKSLDQIVQKIVKHGIIEAIGDAVSIHDTDFRVLYQNDIAKKMIGDHVGKYCYKAFENNDAVCEGCPLELSLKDGKVRTVERRNPSEKDLVVEITTSAIKDAAGTIIGGIEVVRNITERKRMDEERERLVVELKEALSRVKTLKGLLPICACCNKVREKDDVWTNIDVYISNHSDAEITHGYCPQCVKKQFRTDDKNVF